MALETHALPSPQFCSLVTEEASFCFPSDPISHATTFTEVAPRTHAESLLGPGLCLKSDALGLPVQRILVIQEGLSWARAAFRNGLGFQRDSWSARVETLSYVFPQTTRIAQLPLLPSPCPPALSSTQISNLEVHFAFSLSAAQE